MVTQEAAEIIRHYRAAAGAIRWPSPYALLPFHAPPTFAGMILLALVEDQTGLRELLSGYRCRRGDELASWNLTPGRGVDQHSRTPALTSAGVRSNQPCTLPAERLAKCRAGLLLRSADNELFRQCKALGWLYCCQPLLG